MQTEPDTTVRRKKNFRARGSRGGARRKKENRHHQNHQMNPTSQYYSNGYAPNSHSHPHPHQYQRNQHQPQYYYNQEDSTQHQMGLQHHNHAHCNTYASMAYTQDLALSQSWGSTTVSSKETIDHFNNESFNPNQENMIDQHDSILPHLPPPTAKANNENANETKQISMAILPMQKVDLNQKHEYETENLCGDPFLRKSAFENSLNTETRKLNSSIAIPDANLNSSSDNGPTFIEQFNVNGSLDLFSAMHPTFDTANDSHQNTIGQRDNNVFSQHLTSRCSGESYFVTSPKSFLMGKKDSKILCM